MKNEKYGRDLDDQFNDALEKEADELGYELNARKDNNVSPMGVVSSRTWYDVHGDNVSSEVHYSWNDGCLAVSVLRRPLDATKDHNYDAEVGAELAGDALDRLDMFGVADVDASQTDIHERAWTASRREA